jgi:copper chaperone CopZ
MKKAEFSVPAMYADHHVAEVRRILEAIPGVSEIYASSAFQAVEVEYDPAVTNDLDIAVKLDEAGYLGEWSLPKEASVATYQSDDQQAYFRHTAVYESSRNLMGFTQQVKYEGRPLWPCPGFGVIRKQMEE